MKIFGLGSIVDQAKALIDTKIKLLKLEIKDSMASVLAYVIIGIVLLNLVFFALFFISIAIGILLGQWVDNYAYGFLILGGVFILIFVLILVFKKKIGLKEFLEEEFNKILKLNE